jgi:Outer membrane protein beta-barrel domain
MKPHKFPSAVGRALLVLIFGLVISFSNTAIAVTPGGYDEEIAKGNPSYSKTTEPDGSGGYTERTYYTDANGIKQLVEIKKYPKGAKVYNYHWIRYIDEKGNTVTKEESGTESTKTVVDKDGNTTTYTWDKGDWRFKSKTPKAASSGPKRAPGAPELETAPGNSLFEFGAGYTHMQTDGEEVRELNGFNTSAFYNVNPWLAVGGEFSGLYGSKTFFGGMEDVSLDRYLYLFGARVSYPVAEPVRLYGQVLLGGVHDINNVSFQGGSSSSSADAFAMSFGVGADFRVTRCLSLGPSFDYVPTNFSGGNGNNWQNNWRANLNARINFGGRRGP